MRRLLALAVAAVTTMACPRTASADGVFSDLQVQMPSLGEPTRGSLAGQYASVAFGPADVDRGAFNLALPIAVPEERGTLGVHAFPTYSPDAGISEWGIGWSVALAVTRSRLAGDLDYLTDERTGPWGRMVKGSDGYWYAATLDPLVRMEDSGADLVAYLPDGSKWSFGGASRITTAAGTYAWYLNDVSSPTGDRIHIDYVGNDSGKLFPSVITYGKASTGYQPEIHFAYDLLTTPFLDYRAGRMLELDRRVARVVMDDRHATTGALGKRWRYDFSYVAEAVGPAFYLSGVLRTYASGKSDPPVSYGYALGSSSVGGCTPHRVPKLDSLFASAGSQAIQPDRASIVDVDYDGRADIELADTETLYVQSDSAYLAQPTPTPTGNVDPLCRLAPAEGNPPRELLEMRPREVPRVVRLIPDDDGVSGGTLHVCSAAADGLFQQHIDQIVSLGPRTRMADLNRDHQPEIVSVFAGGYRVAPNTSNAAGYAFGTPVEGVLDPAVSVDTIWIADVNGDSVPDLVSRTDSNMLVWLGT